MAVTLDQNLGANSVASGASMTLSTAAAAAAGSKIVVFQSWWSSAGATPTLSGGGLTWTKRPQNNNATGDRVAIWEADAPAGLAISTVLTFGINGAADGGLLMGAASFLGVGTFDTSNTTTGSGTGLSSGAATNATAGALVTGVAGWETAATASVTATSGTELHDRWQTGAGQGFWTAYLIPAGTGSQSVTGTLTASSTANTGAIAIWSPSGAPAGGADTWKQLSSSMSRKRVPS